MTIDWSKIHEGKLESVEFLVGTFKVMYPRAPDDLKVDIWQTRNELVPYVGVANYSYWGPDQGGPYRSTHGGKTIEDAFNDAIRGFFTFDRDDYPNELAFWVKDGTSGELLFDGNGNQVDRKTAEDRRRNKK